MRNFKNWEYVIENAKRGDRVSALRLIGYKGKTIVDADSTPRLYTQKEWLRMENERFAQYYGIDWI